MSDKDFPAISDNEDKLVKLLSLKVPFFDLLSFFKSRASYHEGFHKGKNYFAQFYIKNFLVHS